MNSKLSLQSKLHFLGELDGHEISVDADAAFGGEDQGARPKGLLLTALIGCTGMDVISILRKMRLEPKAFSVSAEAEVSDNHPKVFTHIRLTYHFKGELPHDKLKKAITLSQDRYCAVSAMLKPVVPIDWELVTEA